MEKSENARFERTSCPEKLAQSPSSRDKLLCDQAGYKRFSEAVERIMLKCIEQRSLGIPPKGPREIELIRRVELLAKRVELSKRLGRKKSSGFRKLPK